MPLPSMTGVWFDHRGTYPAAERPDLLAIPVAAAVPLIPEALVFEVDDEMADTEAMCAHYGVPMETSANIVLVTGFRNGERRDVGCMTLAHRRVDVNNVVRRRLDVRKASFTPMDEAVAASGMHRPGLQHDRATGVLDQVTIPVDLTQQPSVITLKAAGFAGLRSLSTGGCSTSAGTPMLATTTRGVATVYYDANPTNDSGADIAFGAVKVAGGWKDITFSE